LKLFISKLGGLLLTSSGKVSSTDGDITYLGRIMANLPIDVQLTRLIVFGQIFGIYESCLIIGLNMDHFV
jgi:ATP-dependent RNA helicase TDRD9